MATNITTEAQYQAWLYEQRTSMEREAIERTRKAQLPAAHGAVINVSNSGYMGYAGNGPSSDAKPTTNKKVLLLCQS